MAVRCGSSRPRRTSPPTTSSREEELVLTLGARRPDRRTVTLDDCRQLVGLDVLQADAAAAVAGTRPARARRRPGRHRQDHDAARRRRRPPPPRPDRVRCRPVRQGRPCPRTRDRHRRPTRSPSSSTNGNAPTGHRAPLPAPRRRDRARRRSRHDQHPSARHAHPRSPTQQHWRLVLVGDPHQLQAVGRGGLFHELCATGRTHELQRIHRFTARVGSSRVPQVATRRPARLGRLPRTRPGRPRHASRNTVTNAAHLWLGATARRRHGVGRRLDQRTRRRPQPRPSKACRVHVGRARPDASAPASAAASGRWSATTSSPDATTGSITTSRRRAGPQPRTLDRHRHRTPTDR